MLVLSVREAWEQSLRREGHVRDEAQEEIAALLDPTAYTGECAAIASAQATRARVVAAEIEAAK